MSVVTIEQHETYVKALRNQGIPLAEYSCPGCEAKLHSLIPRPEEDRDYAGLAACPYCDGQHFRLTCDDGSVWIRVEAGEPLREVTA